MITLERFPSVSSGITIRLSLLRLDGSAAAAACFSKVATGNFESLARRLQQVTEPPGEVCASVQWNFRLWRVPASVRPRLHAVSVIPPRLYPPSLPLFYNRNPVKFVQKGGFMDVVPLQQSIQQRNLSRRRRQRWRSCLG